MDWKDDTLRSEDTFSEKKKAQSRMVQKVSYTLWKRNPQISFKT